LHEVFVSDEDIAKRLIYAENILSMISTGFWIHILNENSPGQNIGDKVMEYWKTFDAPDPTPNSTEGK